MMSSTSLTGTGHAISGGQTSMGNAIIGQTASIGGTPITQVPDVDVPIPMFNVPIFNDDVVPFPGTKEADAYIAKLMKYCMEMQNWKNTVFKQWKASIGTPNMSATNHAAYVNWTSAFLQWYRSVNNSSLPINMSTGVPPFPPMPLTMLPPPNSATSALKNLPSVDDQTQNWSYADYIDKYTWSFCEMWEGYIERHQELKNMQADPEHQPPEEEGSKPPDDADPQDDATPDEIKDPYLTTPTPTASLPLQSTPDESKKGIKTGAALAIGGVVFALLGLAGFTFYMKQRGKTPELD